MSTQPEDETTCFALFQVPFGLEPADEPVDPKKGRAVVEDALGRYTPDNSDATSGSLKYSIVDAYGLTADAKVTITGTDAKKGDSVSVMLREQLAL